MLINIINAQTLWLPYTELCIIYTTYTTVYTCRAYTWPVQQTTWKGTSTIEVKIWQTDRTLEGCVHLIITQLWGNPDYCVKQFWIRSIFSVAKHCLALIWRMDSGVCTVLKVEHIPPFFHLKNESSFVEGTRQKVLMWTKFCVCTTSSLPALHVAGLRFVSE